LDTERPNAEELLSALTIAIQDLNVAASEGETLGILRRCAAQLTDAQGVAVVMRDGDQCHYLADDSDSELWPDQRFPMESCISGWAMLNGQPAVVPNVFQDPRVPHHLYGPTFVRSLIMTPMGDGEAFAALGVYWDHARDHSQSDVELLRTLADCAASTLGRIRATPA
jgi:two-component system CheB/CheR fusion protein